PLAQMPAIGEQRRAGIELYEFILLVVAIAAFELEPPIVEGVAEAAQDGPAGVEIRLRRIGVGDDADAVRRLLHLTPIFIPVGAAFDAHRPTVEMRRLRRSDAKSQSTSTPKQYRRVLHEGNSQRDRRAAARRRLHKHRDANAARAATVPPEGH